MAANPAFAATPRIGAASAATADSSFTSPTNVVTVLTGASAGTKIQEVVVKSAATSSAAILRLWLYESSTTTYWLFDEILIAAVTGSATLAQNRVSTTYSNLVLPSASWSLRASVSVSQTTHVIALGADL